MTDEEFRNYIQGSLSCRLTDKDKCGDKMDVFLQRCFYQPGQYADSSDYATLSDRMGEFEKVKSILFKTLYLNPCYSSMSPNST